MQQIKIGPFTPSFGEKSASFLHRQGEFHAHAQATQALGLVQHQARAVAFGDGLDDGQPQAAAVGIRAGHAVEAAEDALALLGRDAGAAVFQDKVTPTGLARRSISTVPPCGVYLMALSTRLRSMMLSASAWPATLAGSM